MLNMCGTEGLEPVRKKRVLGENLFAQISNEDLKKNVNSVPCCNARPGSEKREPSARTRLPVDVRTGAIFLFALHI